jgi:hypothetical protein
MFSNTSQSVRHPSISPRASSRRTYDRLELLWAAASFVVLILCWDRASRLDERVSIPRVRIAHVLEEERAERTGITHPVTDFE